MPLAPYAIHGAFPADIVLELSYQRHMRELRDVASELLKRQVAYVLNRARALSAKLNDRRLRKSLRAVATYADAGEWQKALHHAERAAVLARQSTNLNLVGKTSRELMRLDAYGEAWSLLVAARRLRRRSLPDWDGGDLSGTLLVENRPRDLGPHFRMARLIGPASARARHCIAIAEKRMVPLLQRTFPKACIRSETEDLTQDLLKADAVAGVATLGHYFAPDKAAIEASFMPLQPDPSLVSQFREAYKSGKDQPLIGIAWATSNKTRMQHVPSIESWARFLRNFPATYVSLQYRLEGTSIAQLETASNVRVIDDHSVDQWLDLDRFAGQIASLDAVVTIAVTGADAAGALGVRCIEIVGDKSPISVPVTGCKTPWYPHTRIIRKQGRTWEAVFEEVEARLKHYLLV